MLQDSQLFQKTSRLIQANTKVQRSVGRSLWKNPKKRKAERERLAERRGQRASQARTRRAAASATHPPLQVKTHRAADVTTRKLKYFKLLVFVCFFLSLSFPGRGSAERQRGPTRSEGRCDRPAFPLSLIPYLCAYT